MQQSVTMLDRASEVQLYCVDARGPSARAEWSCTGCRVPVLRGGSCTARGSRRVGDEPAGWQRRGSAGRRARERRARRGKATARSANRESGRRDGRRRRAERPTGISGTFVNRTDTSPFDSHRRRTSETVIQALKQRIRHVPDFPKPGILFYDVTTLLKDREGFRMAVNEMAAPYAD